MITRRLRKACRPNGWQSEALAAREGEAPAAREGETPAELGRTSARRLSRSFALPRQKRGVVLLIVVSLLSLFILLGVTYMVAARLAYNTSRFTQAKDQRGDAPETEVDLVVGQILYDTAARTVLQYHSLLMDLYGGDSVTGTVGVGGITGTPPVQPSPAGTTDGNQFAVGYPNNYTNPVPGAGSNTGQFFTFQVKLQP